MKFKDIDTPEKFLEFMTNNINYGFVDNDKKRYGSWNEEEFENACLTKWSLSSPKRLLEVGYGHCWDQVEFERNWFIKHNYNVKTFYIWFELSYENAFSTHTYLVFESNGKWNYFEHSDFANRGIYSFDTLKDAVNYQKSKFIEFNSKTNLIDDTILKSLKIYEYDKPKYGSSMNEFIEYILDTGKLYN